MLEELLSKYWGFSSFRPNQREIILSVINGHDSLVQLPTGGGKSICYQLPALAKKGVCLVFSPLIALMKDHAIIISTTSTSHTDMSWKILSSGNTFSVLMEGKLAQMITTLDIKLEYRILLMRKLM